MLRSRCRPASGVADMPKQRHGADVSRASTMATPALSAASNPAASAKPARRVVGATSRETLTASATATATPAGTANRSLTSRNCTSDEAKARRACPLRSLLAEETRKTVTSRP